MDNGDIPVKDTMGDPNAVSPKFEWTNVPANTASFVFALEDAEGAVQKRNESTLHWLIFNIPGTAREMAEGVPPKVQLPDGSVQLKTQFANAAYTGRGGLARPAHHYIYMYVLFALYMKLDLGADATRADLTKAMDGHIVGKAILAAKFQ